MQKVLARRLLDSIPEGKTSLEKLIESKKKSYDLQVELDTKKQQHALKMLQFKNKAEELEQKNLENQQEVVSKDRYVRDNWNKRQREEERLMQEEKALQAKQKDLDDLMAEHDRLIQREAEIKTQLTATLPYKNYLDSVFEAAPEMVSTSSLNEVQGIVTKYKTLKEWRGTLQVRLLRSKKELQKLRDAIKVYDESSTNTAVEIDYQLKCIAQAQESSFKEFGRERHHQETIAIQHKNKAKEAATIRLTIENMFQKAQYVSNNKFFKPVSKANNLLEKFEIIKNLISDMIEIEQATKNRNSPSKNSYQK